MIRMTALAAIFIQAAMTAALATQVLLYSPHPTVAASVSADAPRPQCGSDLADRSMVCDGYR
jgi:hypothetical protein